MSTLDGDSTLAQVEAAYDSNASYLEDASASKCKAFITACVIWLRRAPRHVGKADATLTLSADLVQRELTAAREWLQANASSDTSTSSSNPRTTRVSFESFRD